MFKSITKKSLLFFMMIIMLFTSISVGANEDWEKSTFSSWTAYNIYAGKNELYNISTKLDRANLSYLLVEAFDMQMKGEFVSIKDVNEKDWFYSYAQIALSQGIMFLEDGYFYPQNFIEREQLPSILSFLPINIKSVSSKEYLDKDEISLEHLAKMTQFMKAGYISDVSTDYLFPKRIATIGDFITVIDKIFPNVSKGILKGQEYNGNFVLKKRMTYLENVTINGNLIITQGAIEDNFIKGNYRISLVNVKVNGDIYVYGGSLYGNYVLDNVIADNIFIVTENPVIFNINNSLINEIENNSSLANFITNMNLNIKGNNGNVTQIDNALPQD